MVHSIFTIIATYSILMLRLHSNLVKQNLASRTGFNVSGLTFWTTLCTALC